ncbi:MAG: ribbon-helix-helix protein, CopG family [Ruminococcaceae bacterium]|nr:ribbon-helix-helix protein, CopG family [Oscillospiraceae bacterium]
MSQLKKVLITVPENLLKEADELVQSEKMNRSEFVREAMKLYIKEKRRSHIRSQMEKGYQEMAEINLAVSEMYFEAENDAFSVIEEKLAECE